MRTLQFIKKEIQHVLDSRDSLVMMIIFPFALTLVLGMALSGMFNQVIDMPDVTMPIVSAGDMQSKLFITQAQQAGLQFEETNLDDAKEQAATNGEGYLHLDEQGITFKTDNPGSINSLMVRTYGRIYARQASLAALAMQHGRLDLAAPQEGNYVTSQGIDTKKEPNSFGYYGITMLTMIMLYGTIQTTALMDIERKQRTYIRLKASPYSMSLVYLSKAFMATLTLLMQALILMGMNTLFFGVDYRSIPMVLLMLAPYALFCNGLGLMVYQVANSFSGGHSAVDALLNLMIVALAYLGGSYFPLDYAGETLQKISSQSPVALVNSGLFGFIYNHDYSGINKAMAILGGLGALFLIIAFVLYKKEEGSDRVAGY